MYFKKNIYIYFWIFFFFFFFIFFFFFFLFFFYLIFFFFYSLNFFCLLVLLLRPSNFSVYLWSLRYFFIFIIFNLWILAGFMNSIDIYFSSVWDLINLKTRSLIYGPDFYSKFLHKTNYEIIWSNRTRTRRFVDSWYNNSLIHFYRHKFYYINLVYEPLNNYIHYKYLTFLYTTSFGLKYRESQDFFKIYLHRLRYRDWALIPYFRHIKYFLWPFYEQLALKSLDFGVDTPFHSVYIYYRLFSMFFLTFNQYAYAKFLAKVTIMGVSQSFLNLNFINLKTQQIGFLRLSYYRHMFDILRFNLWGKYPILSSSYFMFYRRKWFMTEKQFFYLIVQNAMPNKRRHDLGAFHILNRPDRVMYFRLFDDSLVSDKIAYDLAFETTHIIPIKRYNTYVTKRLNVEYKNHYNYSLFYAQYLVPDVGFIGSANWAVNWKYLSIDKSLKLDSFYFKLSRKSFRRHW